jgi:hypothetical protein
MFLSCILVALHMNVMLLVFNQLVFNGLTNVTFGGVVSTLTCVGLDWSMFPAMSSSVK